MKIFFMIYAGRYPSFPITLLSRLEFEEPTRGITFGCTLTSQPIKGMHLKLTKLKGLEC